MQQGFFSEQEMADMAPGFIPPAPEGYSLPTAFPDISRAKRISLDFETFDPYIDIGSGCRRGAYAVGYAIAAEDHNGKIFHSEYYPLRHKAGPNIDEDKGWNYLRDNLNKFHGEITGANVVLYDGDLAQTKGVRPPCKWRDVQWAEALIDEIAPSYKLDAIGKKYLGIGKTTDKLRGLYGPSYIERFHEVHPGHARPYALGDVTLPLLIRPHQEKALADLGMTDLYDIECRLAPFLLYMRDQGVRVHRGRAESLGKTFDAQRDLALQQASKLSGVPFNVENFGKPSLLAYAFNKLGIPVPKTEGGRDSVKDKWLENLEHPFGRALSVANRFDKAKETFVDGYITDYLIGDRIHAEFNPLRRVDDEGVRGAVSGRFSGSNPNLQNIPVKDHDDIAKQIGPFCRAMFVPEEGAQWWSLDYSQIEYRFLIHYAVMNACKGADAARQMYIDKPDTDFHQALADLTGLPRKLAKTLNFGLLYGMGLIKLAMSLGHQLLPNGKARPETLALMNTYHAGAPFIKEMLNLYSDMARDTGEVRTILNRRSQFVMYDAGWRDGLHTAAMLYLEAVAAYGFDVVRAMTHKGLNRLLQGSAADLMKLAMVRSWEAGVYNKTDLTCSLTVHDELDGSLFPTARGKEAFAETREIMRTAMTLNVPILVSDGVGADWNEAK